MTIKDYEEEMKIQFGYLDQIDIEKYMKNCDTERVSEIIDAIERDYNNTNFTNNDFLQGCIFNHCNEIEFIEYLEERFGKRFMAREHSYHTFTLDN